MKSNTDQPKEEFEAEEEFSEFIQIFKNKIRISPLDIKKFKKMEAVGYYGPYDIFKLQDKDTKEIYAGEFYQVPKNSDLSLVNNLSLQFAYKVFILSQISHPSIIKFIGYSFEIIFQFYHLLRVFRMQIKLRYFLSNFLFSFQTSLGKFTSL